MIVDEVMTKIHCNDLVYMYCISIVIDAMYILSIVGSIPESRCNAASDDTCGFIWRNN